MHHSRFHKQSVGSFESDQGELPYESEPCKYEREEIVCHEPHWRAVVGAWCDGFCRLLIRLCPARCASGKACCRKAGDGRKQAKAPPISVGRNHSDHAEWR